MDWSNKSLIEVSLLEYLKLHEKHGTPTHKEQRLNGFTYTFKDIRLFDIEDRFFFQTTGGPEDAQRNTFGPGANASRPDADDETID